ncbi:hypothetical protein [Paenibacillus dokdonensis]|uniref:hypothetical protein n=1 Tax=Paenibacillus dokdonensis TaxID=2567944 RepID=UPI001B3C4E86|nr:hypothetical protein [Paenibacillus dokdonensis]
MKKNIMISIILIIVIGLVVYWNLPKEDQEVFSEISLSVNDQSIKLIKEGKYTDSWFLIDADLKEKYGNYDNLKIDRLSQDEQNEYNLMLFSMANSLEQDEAYIPSLKYLKEVKPIDGIVTQEEIDSKIAYLTPKAEEAKAVQDIPSNVSIGMTKEEVLASTWGKPKDINKTTTANYVSEQWVYSGYRYLYFENGILTTIQN